MSGNVRMKEKLFALLVILAAVASMAGCSGQQTPQEGPEAVQTEFILPEPVTQLVQLDSIVGDEDRVYCLQEQWGGLVLTCYDKTTATSRVFCQKEGCAHNSPQCPAYFVQNGAHDMFVYGGGLYVLESSIDGFALYRMEQGQGKTLVLSQGDIGGYPELSSGSLSARYFDGNSLYLAYELYSQNSAAILEIRLANNTIADHDMIYGFTDLPASPAIRWFGPVSNGKILLRNSLEELLLLDPEMLRYGQEQAITPLDLTVSGGWLRNVWDGMAYVAEYDYDLQAWKLYLMDIETGETLYYMDTSQYGYRLDYYPLENLDMALLEGPGQDIWKVNWDTGTLTELTLVRWTGAMQQTILPVAQCGDQYLVRVRDELYLPFYIQPSGYITTEPIYTGQYAFISVEDYLAGQPNYRIIQQAQ